MPNPSPDRNTPDLAVDRELHACPECGYQQGFHVAFVREKNREELRLELICPNCSARFNLNRYL